MIEWYSVIAYGVIALLSVTILPSRRRALGITVAGLAALLVSIKYYPGDLLVAVIILATISLALGIAILERLERLDYCR